MSARSERPSRSAGDPIAEQIEDGRQDVRVPGGRGCHPGSEPRRRENQWDPERRIVREQPVGGFSVIAERLSVIGSHDDECAIQLPAIPKLLQGRPQRGVRPRDLGIVRRAVVRERRRCAVGRMRIEQMHPGEPRADRRRLAVR